MRNLYRFLHSDYPTHRERKFRSPIGHPICLLLGIAVMLGFTRVNAQTIPWTNAAASTAWYTATNWTPNTASGAWLTTNLAQFNNTGTATQAGVNLGTASLSIGAIEVTNARTRALTVGNSSATGGTITLNGMTVNAVANTILRNNSGFALTVAAAGGAGAVTLPLVATTSMINVDGAGDISIAYPFTGSSKNIQKDGAGAGKLIYTATNHSYTGTTTVNTGELRLNPSANASFASQIVLNTGSTLSTTGIAATRTWTSTSTLNLAGNATLALNNATAHTITFANSSGVTWSGTTLTVTGWTGSAGSSGTNGKIFFGNDNTGLTGTQLGKISFTGFPGTPIMLNTGEVVPPGPTLSSTPLTLTGFSYNVGAGPSTSQSSSLSGSSLTPAAGNITVSGSTNYEVSSDNVSFGASATIPYAGSALSSTNYYVRLKAGLSTGNYNGETISISGGGASTSITASGTVIGPNVTGTGTLTKMYANQGFPSDYQTITVSGTNLTTDLTVTLAGYEFSTLANGPYTNTFSLSPVSGTVSSTTVYARLEGTSAGVYNGNIVITSTGANTVNLAATGEVYAPGVAFTSGNIVAFRVGDGAAALSSAAAPSFFDEMTSVGGAVQSVALPFAVVGSQRRIAIQGTSTTEANIALSPDKRYLVFGGYDAVIGSASPNSTSSATTNRIIGIIDNSASINSSTRINDIGTSTIRSAVTLDGTAFWMAGTGGVNYAPLGNTGTSNQLATLNTRVLRISNSQLVVTSASGINIGVNKVGTGLPTSGLQTVSLWNGLTPADGYGCFFLDRDASIPGNDLVYIANNANGLFKYSFDGTSWTQRGSLTGTTSSVAARISGASIELFVTVGTGSGNSIRRITDAAAYNANITGNGSALTAVGSLVSTAPANTAFRGVAFAPVATPQADVAHFQENPTPTNLAQGASNQQVYRIRIEPTTADALLTGITLTTSGTYTASDVDNFKLYFSDDDTWDGGDILLSTKAVPTGSGESLAFTGISQTFDENSVKYLLITTDVSGCAVIGRTISATTATANLTYTNANKTGTLAAGSTFSVVAGLPSNVTGLAPTNAGPGVQLDWVNPTCFTDVVIIASTSPIVGTPTGVLPAHNTNYNLAPSVAGGKLVYVGGTSPQVVTGLTLGITYYFKVFTRYSGQISTGVEVNIVPQISGLFSRGTGLHTDPIWSLTPTGTPATAASLGGFGINRNIIVQSGNTVTLNTSGISARDVIVYGGAKLDASGAVPGDMKYINLFGGVYNDGTIGNGAIFNPIGFNLEGSNNFFYGNGSTNLGRLRKNGSSSLITNVSFDHNVNILFPGIGLYNAAANTKLNVTVKQYKTLSLTDATGSISLDGNDFGTPDVGEIATNLVVNGTLNVGSTIRARNNNATAGYGTNITVGSSGIINVPSLIVNMTSGQGNTFNLNGKINISGDLTLEAGTLPSNGGLVFKSGPLGTARIAQTTGSISGNVTVERYIPSYGWHFLGTAVAGQTIADWNDDIQTTGPMPGVSVPNPGSNTSSIFLFNQAGTINDNLGQINGWEVPTTTNLIQYQGYRVWVPGPKIIDNTGAITLGSQTINLAYSGATPYIGYNIVTNPHLSAIDWTLVTKNSTANTAIVWNPTAGTYQYFGSPIGSVPLNAAINPIASGQGFMVKATAPGANIVIPESAKSTLSGSFFRTSTDETNRISLTLVNASTQASDDALFKFMDGTTSEFDQEFDATKFSNPGMNIYTITPSYSLMAINALPFEGAQMVVPVGLSAEAGNYTLNVGGMENMVASSHAFLRDFETGALIDLDVTTSYSFTIFESGTINNRFELIFTPQSVTEVKENLASGIAVYPNPVSGATFRLNVYGSEVVNSVWIEDVTGKRVSDEVVYPSSGVGNSYIVTKPKSSGVYFVKAVVSGKTVTSKLVVQ